MYIIYVVNGQMLAYMQQIWWAKPPDWDSIVQKVGFLLNKSLLVMIVLISIIII